MGQDKDLVNPCSLLAFMGSIANEGEAVVPNLVGSETIGGTAIPAALPDGRTPMRPTAQRPASA
mgnify:FL=1